MATTKELIASLKSLLKDNLNDTNMDLFTKIDKGLDDISVAHEKTEEDLSITKDKLIEVVKNTAFKDSEPEDIKGNTQDEPMDIDSALENAISETLANRKGE